MFRPMGNPLHSPCVGGRSGRGQETRFASELTEPLVALLSFGRRHPASE
jgi:hypothetical protein